MYVTRLQTDSDQVDYTPSGAAAVGDVVVAGEIMGIVPSGRAGAGIEDGELGALQVDEGPWLCPKQSGGGTALTFGQAVYWDATNHRVDPLASVGRRFGTVIKAAADGDTTVAVRKLEDGPSKQATYVAALTDSSGGAAADGTIGVITLPTLAGWNGSTDPTAAEATQIITAATACRDAIKELATKVNAIQAALVAAGLMAAS